MILDGSILLFKAFDPTVLLPIAILLVLLFCSAMASGSETALFSLSPSDIGKIKSLRSRANEAIRNLLSDQDYMLATILIANNLVNICIVILSNNIINRLVTFGGTGWEFLFKTVIVTFLLLLFGEIMPKIFATYNAYRFARLVAVPLVGLRTLFRPVSFLLVKMSRALHNRAAQRGNISMDELSDAIEITSNQSQEEKRMLSGIVGFVNTQVEEIMKPRMDIVSLDIEAGFEQVKQVILQSGFSRIPVWRESIDNIEGVLYVKDMLPFIARGDDFAWQTYLRKPYYVPEHKKINDLLEEFQAGKVHLAIVVDEYGSTLGLVSLEDILEEVVGEISDESDTEERFYTRIDDRTYIFEGKTHIVDFCRVLALDESLFDQVRGEAETVAGLMLELRRDFLRKGDRLRTHGIEFTVESVEGRRIDKIRVVIPAAAPVPA